MGPVGTGREWIVGEEFTEKRRENGVCQRGRKPSMYGEKVRLTTT